MSTSGNGILQIPQKYIQIYTAHFYANRSRQKGGTPSKYTSWFSQSKNQNAVDKIFSQYGR